VAPMSAMGGKRTLGGAHLTGGFGRARECGKAHRPYLSKAASTHGIGALPHRHERCDGGLGAGTLRIAHREHGLIYS
jgi:hypothetical protein